MMYTEVQGTSFVGNTEGEGSKPRSWNLQNLCPVPPYCAVINQKEKEEKKRKELEDFPWESGKIWSPKQESGSQVVPIEETDFPNFQIIIIVEK